MPSFTVIGAVAFAVTFLLDLDGGFAGVGAAGKLVMECVEGDMPWCDQSFPARMPKLAVAMLFDKLQSNAIDVAERHAPGTDSLKGKVAIVTGATHGVGLETARVLMKKAVVQKNAIFRHVIKRTIGMLVISHPNYGISIRLILHQALIYVFILYLIGLN